MNDYPVYIFDNTRSLLDQLIAGWRIMDDEKSLDWFDDFKHFNNFKPLNALPPQPKK